MNAFRVIVMLISLTIFFSCDSDEVQDDAQPLLIGVDNSLFEITTLDPVKLVTSPGIDSLDLNHDLQFDLFFLKYTVASETGFKSMTGLVKSAGVQVSLSKENDQPDTLAYGNLLSDQLNWSDSQETGYSLENFDCVPGSNCPTDSNNPRYLAVKINDRFGWVKIQNTHDVLRIEEYALMK